MPRLMSVNLTEQAVVERRKTVTRRLGWRHAHPGMRLTLCRKVMGRFHRGPDGTIEPLVRLAEVEIVSARRERLTEVTDEDVVREGFPDMDVGDFVAFFCEHMGCEPDEFVTRIEWRYLDAPIAEPSSPVDMLEVDRGE